MSNIQKALEAKQQKYIKKIIGEAASRFRPTKHGENEFNAQKFINRLETTMAVENVSLSKAVELQFSTLSFTTPEQNYLLQIRQALSAKQRAQIRLAILRKKRLENPDYKFEYKFTTINFEGWFYQDGWAYDPTMAVRVKIVEGTDSNQPDFLEIEELA